MQINGYKLNLFVFIWVDCKWKNQIWVCCCNIAEIRRPKKKKIVVWTLNINKIGKKHRDETFTGFISFYFSCKYQVCLAKTNHLGIEDATLDGRIQFIVVAVDHVP